MRKTESSRDFLILALHKARISDKSSICIASDLLDKYPLGYGLQNFS